MRGVPLFCVLAAFNSQVAFAGSATVTVPANATGGFGNPIVDYVDMIPALKVTGPGSVRIIYKSGTISDSGFPTISPKGVTYNLPSGQLPLQERAGILNGTSTNFDALIGAFVPANVANSADFQPHDATKGTVKAGILPSDLFFVGQYTSFDVSGPGTIYLGINDSNGSSNTGSFTVQVASP